MLLPGRDWYVRLHRYSYYVMQRGRCSAVAAISDLMSNGDYLVEGLIIYGRDLVVGSTPR